VQECCLVGSVLWASLLLFAPAFLLYWGNFGSFPQLQLNFHFFFYDISVSGTIHFSKKKGNRHSTHQVEIWPSMSNPPNQN